VFSADDVPALREFLQPRVERGEGVDVLNRNLNGKHRPSKKLMEHVVGVIKGNQEFVLLDEQLVVFDKVLSSVTGGFHDKRKRVVLVKGGPGTGKSVIAINLVAELMRRSYNAHYVTGSRAFTQTLRKVIGSRGEGQFKYFNSYTDSARDEIDALICDEAHRLRESSKDRFHPRNGKPGVPQINELLNAGRVSVFFIDDDQVVRPGEIGSADYIRDAAKRSGCDLSEYELDIQFRCGGSDAFVKWIENTLAIRKTPNILWSANEDFEFRIIDSPISLEMAIRERAGQGYKARLMAGFCWPWSKKLGPDGRLVNDVVIGNYVRAWNAHPEIGKLARGIPRAPVWAHDPNGINQVGCVYTAQGFEFDYAGVIFGPDLRYSFDRGEWEGHPEDSQDSVVKKSKGKFTDLVKNTYRVLLSRALKGCYVCFVDKETEKFFRSRMECEETAGKAVGGEVAARAYTLFVNALPLFSYEIGTGKGGELRINEEMCPVPPGNYGTSHFLVRAEDEKMAPMISKGALCLFKRPEGESLVGKIVLCRLKGTTELPLIAKIGTKALLEVHEGKRSERSIWMLDFVDTYAQSILLNNLGDAEILGIFEALIHK
jgi:hypothetical protein